jgi:monoterpene epsilon-lactone hydrolase
LLFSREAAAYLQGVDAETPLASPVLAPLDGVPSTLIIVGSAEVLLQDSLDFAARLAAHSIGVQLVVVPHMQHVSTTLFPDLPSSVFGVDVITRFARERLDGAGLVADPNSNHE